MDRCAAVSSLPKLLLPWSFLPALDFSSEVSIGCSLSTPASPRGRRDGAGVCLGSERRSRSSHACSSRRPSTAYERCRGCRRPVPCPPCRSRCPTSTSGARSRWSDGRPHRRPKSATRTSRSLRPGYFAAMADPAARRPLARGSRQRTAPMVAVISEALRRREWPTESPVGRRHPRFLAGKARRSRNRRRRQPDSPRRPRHGAAVGSVPAACSSSHSPR